jgi:hypothetical protein
MSLVACGEVADSAAADPTVPAIEVTSVELAKAFEANEVAAQQTYGAAPLLVSGEVADISLDFMDQPVVELPGVNQFMNVQANLGEEGKAASAQLTKGQAVVVRCAKLTEVAGTPMLSDCTIQ